MLKILLLGNTGQLGRELEHALRDAAEVAAYDYPEVDLADASSIRTIIRQSHCQVIVNAAAFTAVDEAERESALAMKINGLAPGILAEEAKAAGALLIHYSTDYVFDGKKGVPYIETDPPCPLNEYGSSKLAGERAVEELSAAYLIMRTAWLYSLRRENFVNKVLRWARHDEVLKVVADQVSNPTWAGALAGITTQLLGLGGKDPIAFLSERNGVYHVAGDGFASRFEWAEHVLRCDPHPEEQVVRQLVPGLTSEFPTPAQRPLFSALDCQKFTRTFGLRLPPWRNALEAALKASAQGNLCC